MEQRDLAIRLAAFRWLEEQTALHGPVLDWGVLASGFSFDGQPIPIANRPRGIFRPRQCVYPLSLKTSPPRTDTLHSYADHWTEQGLFYNFMGEDPRHPVNASLRAAGERGVALIYLFGVAKGRYLPQWPVYVVGEDRDRLVFRVQTDTRDALGGSAHPAAAAEESEGRRRYLTRRMRVRVHQQSFRERVLDAYRSQCALCRLRYRALLDAAHIEPDSEGGSPVVRNGLALCKIHHAAFDRMFLGIRPDGIIQIHTQVLEASDGPMLRHGLQGLHNQKILIPRAVAQRPDPVRLEARFRHFLQTAPLSPSPSR